VSPETIAAVRAWGGDVPDDVSGVGFDGTPAISYTAPRLTTLRQPVDRMSVVATALLITSMDGDGVGQTQVLAPGLVVGRSTGTVKDVVRTS
jgi:DNA-binding LacI/PurR family transcriptional regulator